MSRFVHRAAALWRAVARPASTPQTASPGVLPAYAALARYRLGAVELAPRLRLLVSQLAAERSDCQWCIARGRHVWREAQLPVALLQALAEYDASPLLSESERAALAFADALTRYAEDAGGMSAEPLAAVRRHFSEPEVAALTEAVAAMHFFNPITGALGADAAPAQRSPRNAWPMPAGSSVRNLWL